MSATYDDANAYIDWMHSRVPYKNLRFKIHEYHEQAFPKQTVKYRKQLVAFDRDFDTSEGGTHVSPKEWKEMLEDDKEYLLLDVRNEYESRVGHFEGATLPSCDTSRDFNEYAETLEKQKDLKTPIMMYCTGGIRCEVFSAILKKKGFTHVYQLDGGVIDYGLKEGSKHWLGKLFVFDDRLTVPISEEETNVIGTCHHCDEKIEAYYNCANMDCNTLFLCCPNCIEIFKGCCQSSCQKGARLRPYQNQNPHKPFRKKHNYSHIQAH